MAFREKSAWIMVFALLLGGALYFQAVASLSAAGGSLASPTLSPVVGYTVALVVVAVIGHITAAVFGYRDAAAPADERDRRVADRAACMAGHVLAGGVVVSLGVYLFTGSGALLFYAVLASLMLGGVAGYLQQIVLYRRSV